MEDVPEQNKISPNSASFKEINYLLFSNTVFQRRIVQDTSRFTTRENVHTQNNAHVSKTAHGYSREDLIVLRFNSNNNYQSYNTK
jgi:hypothetical protein